MKFPIKYKLLSIILIVVIPVSLTSIRHYFQMVEDHKNELLNHNKVLVANIAANINLMIERSFAALQALSLHPAVIAKDSVRCDRLFAGLLPSFPFNLNILAAGMDGYNYGSAVPSPGVRRLNYLDMPWFQKGIAGKPFVGNRHVSKLFHVPSVMLTQPVFSQGRQTGVLGMPLDLNRVRDSLARSWKLPADSTSNIVDASGNVLVCICEGGGANRKSDGCEIVQLSGKDRTAITEATGSDGIRRLYSVASVPGTGWTAVIGVPTSVAYHQAFLATRSYLVILASVTLTGLVLALLMSRRVTRSIASVIAGMKEAEEGNLSVQVQAAGDDELRDVATSFNRMALQRRDAEGQLKRSEAFLSSVLEGISAGVVVIDRDFRIISANSGYCKQVNAPREGIIGRACYEVSHHRRTPCDSSDANGCDCAVRKCFADGEHHRSVHVHQGNGTSLHIETRAYPLRDASGAVTAAIETLTDITDRRTLEAQLFQAQKMEAVGILAGGVAHDFNNILTAIMGYGNIVKMSMGPEDPLRPHMEQIQSAAERAAHLTRSLLAFSRKQILDPRPIRLNEVIQRIEKMLRRIIGEDVDLRIDLSAREATVMADAGQIEQVLMNLCTNARDAMPEGGTLLISTDIVELDEDVAKRHGLTKPGVYMQLSVSDTGTGMDERTKEKIFEPFFTTKDTGKGTGLGLSIIYGIIKQHNGSITVASEPGRGATFRIQLPAVRQEAKAMKAPAPRAAAGGSEVILLAEDDSDVRTVAVDILQEQGYRVIPAVDGVDAVEKFHEHAGKVDLAVFDVLMPRKNGKDAYEEIKRSGAGVRVLFMSGYAADLIHQKGVLTAGVELILKPFSPAAFLSKVREVLDK